MPDVEALLLDLYDTLLRPDWETVRAGRASLAVRAGVSSARMLQGWESSLEDRLRGAHGSLHGDISHLLADCGTQADADTMNRLVEHEHDTWRRGVVLYDDVLPSLEAFRARGYRLGIVSNATGETMALIQALGLGDLVDTLVVSCEVKLLKPDPAIFQVALKRLCASPGSTLFVDDVLENLDSARSIGLRTAWMDRGACASPDGAAHPRVTSLADLWPLLGS